MRRTGKSSKTKKKPLYELAIVSKVLNLKDYIRVCPHCKITFIAHRKDKLCCSTLCYNADYYRRHKCSTPT